MNRRENTAMAIRDYLFRPLRLLREPKAISAIYLLIYLGFVAFIGIPTLTYGFQPPPVDPFLVLAVGILTITGGIFAASSLYSGIWWLERLGITFCIGGVAARMIIVNYLAHPHDFWQREGALILICLFLIARFLRIAGLALDPTK